MSMQSYVKVSFFSIFLVICLATLPAEAGKKVKKSKGQSRCEKNRKWNDHAAPFSFLFENKIDSHQETRLTKKGNLFGFLYVTLTGEYTEEGVPIVKHCRGDHPAEDLKVGWVIKGVPAKATFVYHNHDHPVWLIQDRSIMPQPGSYTHFHWTGSPDCCMNLMEGMEYEGFLIQLRAVSEFVFKHCGRMIHIKPGIDNVSHINIVTSFPGYGHGSGMCSMDGSDGSGDKSHGGSCGKMGDMSHDADDHEDSGDDDTNDHDHDDSGDEDMDDMEEDESDETETHDH